MLCLRAGWPGWRAGRTLAGGVHEAPSAPERWVVALGSRRPLPEALHGTLTVRHTHVWDKDCFLVSVTSSWGMWRSGVGSRGDGVCTSASGRLWGERGSGSFGTQNWETKSCGSVQVSREWIKWLFNGTPCSVGKALSSLVSELPEGPAGLSGVSVSGFRCGRDRPAHWTLEVSLPGSACFLCPVGSCSFNPRWLGKCKDVTETAFEAHFEEKFCVSRC